MANRNSDGTWSQPLGSSKALQAKIEKQKKSYCSVLNCHYNSITHPHLSYFKIPSNSERAAAWLARMHRVKKISKKMLVCERHFEDRYVRKNNDTRKRLVAHAVPTLWLPVAEALECTPDLLGAPPAAHSHVAATSTRQVTNCGTSRSKKDEITINHFIKRKPRYVRNSYTNIAEIIKLHRQFRPQKEGERFTDEFKFFVLKLYFECPTTYRLMQPLLSFPKISMLYRLFIPTTTDVCENFIIALKLKVNNMTEEQKQCAVCIGTLDLKENLHYNAKKDEITGFHDVDGSQRPEPASTALVVMVRGIFDTWKQAVAYSFLAKHQTYEDVRTYILKIINKLFDIGLIVRVFISDVESEFIGLSRDKRFNPKALYFQVNNNKVYYMYDPAHLMKDVREHLTTLNFHFRDMIAKWQHITACYDYECEKPVRLAPQLTCYHIIHTHMQSEKDKVKLAAEVFSKSTAAAVYTYAMLKVIDEPVDGTVEWIHLMNKLFKMLNFSSFQFDGETSPPFSGTTEELAFLAEMLTILKDVRLVDAHDGSDVASNSKSLQKLMVTIKVILSLHRDLTKQFGKFPRVGLSRDCLDTFFETVRQLYGRLPTSKQILLAMRQVPIFNVFQRVGKKSTDNLNTFLNEAFTFGKIVMMHEPDESKFINTCYEVTGDINENSVELSNENPLQHLAAYLLYMGYLQHNDCEAMKCYVFETTHSTTVILTIKPKNQTVIVMVPTEFVEFIESMELTLKLYFETECQRNPLTGLKDHLFSENVIFSMPCECFPLDFIKHLYMRYRLNLLLKYNNAEFEHKDESRKYFTVNEL